MGREKGEQKQMKKLVLLLVILTLTGCAGGGVNPDYDAYLDAKADAVKNQQPTFVLKCPPAGCNIIELSYYDPRDQVIITQKLPHPGWAFASSAVRYGFYGFAAYYAFDFLGDAIDGAGDAYTNSFNETGGDNIYNPTNISAGGDIGDTAPWFGDDNSDHFEYNESMNEVILEPLPITE